MKSFALFLLLLSVAPAVAVAQTTTFAYPENSTAVTVGASSASVIGVGQRYYLALLNQSATATIYCNFDATAAVASATAGQLTISPLSGYVWDTGKIPSNNINCIASAASTPMTVLQ